MRAQVVSSTFSKSVIRSRAAMTYAEAQSRIDDERLTDELSVSEYEGHGGSNLLFCWPPHPGIRPYAAW
jgi:hypothetical protein